MLENPLYRAGLKNLCRLPLPWEKLKSKTVLITGATGLIGSYLVDLLMELNWTGRYGISIIGVGRSGERAKERFERYWNEELFHFVAHDVSLPWKDGTKADYIIHTASNAHPVAFSKDPVGTMNANYFGTFYLLQLAMACHAERFLFVSSGEVYGKNNGENAFEEDYCGPVELMNPRSCYPSSKRAAETLCAAFQSQYGVNTGVVRPCHIYGPTMLDSDSRAVAQFIRNALHGEEIVMKSRGEQVRSMCYVSDCASAIMTVLLCGKPGAAYNIADEKSNVSIARLASIIAQAAGTNVVFELPEETERRGYNTVERSVLSDRKIKSLGWSPVETIESGVKKTIEILKAEK